MYILLSVPNNSHESYMSLVKNICMTHFDYFWMVCVWAVFCSSKITLWNTVSCHYNYANFSLLLLKSFLLVASSHHTTKLVLQSWIRRIGYFLSIGLLVNCRWMQCMNISWIAFIYRLFGFKIICCILKIDGQSVEVIRQYSL